MAEPKPLPKKSSRASVSFDPEQYSLLEQIAEQKRVSVAWVVREAVERYLTDRWPLLRKGGSSQ